MTKSHTDRGGARNERGAVLIQVAVALLALLALSSFVFDYGVMWASRGQAQNSADAGALAGAISLAFDSSTDQDGARAKAIALARRNRVWTEAPDITNADVTFPPCPPGAPGLPDTCIKVDVFRNQRAGGSPLPVFFSRLVGITNQGVRATATAQIITGDTTDCLKPWAILDRWDELQHRHQWCGGRVPESGSRLFTVVHVRPVFHRSRRQPAPGERSLRAADPRPKRFAGHRFPAASGRGPSVRDQSGFEYELHHVARLVPRHSSTTSRRSERRRRLSGQHQVLRRSAVELRRAGHRVSNEYRERRHGVLGRAWMLRDRAR